MKQLLILVLLFMTTSVVSAQDFGTGVIVDSAYGRTSNLDERKLQALEIRKSFREGCTKDSLRATEEAKYNLSYSLALPSPAMEEDLFIAEKEFIQILREKEIGYGGYIVGNCFGLPDNCFQWEMNRIVERKFGKEFLKNLETIAIKRFIKNNPDRIFKFEECDQESRYQLAKTYEEMFSKTEADFLKTFEYPEGFIYKGSGNKHSNIEASFILDKQGKVSKIQVDLSLQEKKNYLYSSYLINSLKEFITNSKWKAATYKGVPVLSKMNVLIFYK